MYELYLITFSAPGIPTVSVLPDQTPAQVASGYGGWSVVSRQRRVGLTLWQGKDPLRMSVPILFDGVREAVSQEVPISSLSRMALPPTVGGEPPVVTVRGRSVPRPGPSQWVVEGLTWGNNVLWDYAGNGVLARLRQDCVVNLLEYRADDLTAFKSLAPGSVTTKNGASSSGWPRTYMVKKGDNLRTIAARADVYGDASLWKSIATANKIRDPNSVKAGQRLRIPAP